MQFNINDITAKNIMSAVTFTTAYESEVLDELCLRKKIFSDLIAFFCEKLLRQIIKASAVQQLEDITTYL